MASKPNTSHQHKYFTVLLLAGNTSPYFPCK